MNNTDAFFLGVVFTFVIYGLYQMIKSEIAWFQFKKNFKKGIEEIVNG